MIVVRIELYSMRTHTVTEIGRMYIANDETGDGKRRNYWASVMRRGRKDFTEDKQVVRRSTVKDYPALSYNVWRLVIRALRGAFPEEK